MDKSTKTQNFDEEKYLDLLNDIIMFGVKRDDRTGVGTKSLFGTTLTFVLQKPEHDSPVNDGMFSTRFPLLTTKKIFWKGVVEELLWFISGSTNANILSEKGVKIWNGHSSREFLDKRGFLEREAGDVGPMYGFQWRHFGAKYVDYHTDYYGQGVDQLRNCINLIKNDPYSRRIIMSAWNASDIDNMSLAPCHCTVQFIVYDKYEGFKNEPKLLICIVYQRSADMGLGVPFNVASYSLLTCMIAHSCGLIPVKLVHVMGDCHIYYNHIEGLSQQLDRTPKPFPKLKFNCEPKDIDDYTSKDFEIVDYDPYPAIKLDLAI